MTIADLIADRALVAGTASTGRPCKYTTVRARLDDTDRQAVDDALGHIADELLAAALTRGGHPISERTVARHRRRVCPCPTPANESEVAA